MGHKVSSDVAKRYNHKDKQGKANKLKKAKEMFAILDRTLFFTQAEAPPPSASAPAKRCRQAARTAGKAGMAAPGI